MQMRILSGQFDDRSVLGGLTCPHGCAVAILVPHDQLCQGRNLAFGEMTEANTLKVIS